MKLGKMLTTTLSVVGAIVVVDRLADMVSTAHKRQISKCLSNLDKSNFNIVEDIENIDDCCCSGTVEIKRPTESKFRNFHKILPDIKKYVSPKASDGHENFTFQYSIKVRPSEESIYNEMNEETSTMNHVEKITEENSMFSDDDNIIGNPELGTI